MPGPSQIAVKDGLSHRAPMERLAREFYPDLALLGRLTPVAADALPDPYQALLAHNDHMTVTLEAHHESLMSVAVVEERAGATSYARKSVLTRHSDAAPVQLGVMRIQLAGLPHTVREQIESHAAPLGRILIRHNLLREVELIALWRVTPGEDLRRQLRLPDNQPVFGRSARILVDRRPAVELLEIVRA